MKIFWIRHLPIAGTGRYIGHTDIPIIIPASPAKIVPLPENALWFASPLKRAVATANWLLEDIYNKNTKLKLADELMEQNFGAWENKKYEEVWGNWQNQDPATVKPDGGESFVELCRRVDSWLEYMVKMFDGKPLVVVAHAGTIRAGLRHALNLKPEQALFFAVDYSSVTQVEYFMPHSVGGAMVEYINRPL